MQSFALIFTTNLWVRAKLVTEPFKGTKNHLYLWMKMFILHYYTSKQAYCQKLFYIIISSTQTRAFPAFTLLMLFLWLWKLKISPHCVSPYTLFIIALIFFSHKGIFFKLMFNIQWKHWKHYSQFGEFHIKTKCSFLWAYFSLFLCLKDNLV